MTTSVCLRCGKPLKRSDNVHCSRACALAERGPWITRSNNIAELAKALDPNDWQRMALLLDRALVAIGAETRP